MKILVLGGDGYLGWPTSLFLSVKGYEIYIIDDFSKRKIELEEGVIPLESLLPLQERIKVWEKSTGRAIGIHVGSLTNHRFIYAALEEIQPDVIVHFAEQPSAPYSMKGRSQAVYTQSNNVIGTLNLLFAMRSYCPNAHLVKLGTLGEYGTPNIDIEEGYIKIQHKGREDLLPFPKQPFSFYHLSKVHDSNNIMFACRVWGLRATDLNQGVVYGIDTAETRMDPDLKTSFHYDSIFGTALNRFVAQLVCGVPLTVYGSGRQERGIINLIDTMQCIQLAIENPASRGECRIFNQFTESHSILGLAKKVLSVGKNMGINGTVEHIRNPRVEQEDHYYNPVHTKLVELGLEPHFLSEKIIEGMINRVTNSREAINTETIRPKIAWTMEKK